MCSAFVPYHLRIALFTMRPFHVHIYCVQETTKLVDASTTCAFENLAGFKASKQLGGKLMTTAASVSASTTSIEFASGVHILQDVRNLKLKFFTFLHLYVALLACFQHSMSSRPRLSNQLIFMTQQGRVEF